MTAESGPAEDRRAAAAAGRDHGGGLDAAVARHGGARMDWIDLSTGINPVPYPVGTIADGSWTALPDRGAAARLTAAARRFWTVPSGADVVAGPGASALIARLPALWPGGTAHVPGPTYNEHAAAIRATPGWRLVEGAADLLVRVHPNNPDGRLWDGQTNAAATVIDESFCDTMPERSHVGRTEAPGTIVLKSFGKFWGLAGLRLGFAIGHPGTLAPAGRPSLAELLGPWPVAGPALEIGTRALGDPAWATATRTRLARDAARLDALVEATGARIVGGTDLFRLYRLRDAAGLHDHLARARILTRVFPYDPAWIRFGLPAPDLFPRVAAALASWDDGPRAAP